MPKTPLTAEEIAELERLCALVDEEQHYRLLDVGRNTEASVIQQAYYKLSRKWHPDAFFRRDVGEFGPSIDKIFMGLTEAYQVLSDPKKKQVYDRKHPVQDVLQPNSDGGEESSSPTGRVTRHRKGRRRRERERQRQAEQGTKGQRCQNIKLCQHQRTHEATETTKHLRKNFKQCG